MEGAVINVHRFDFIELQEAAAHILYTNTSTEGAFLWHFICSIKAKGVHFKFLKSENLCSGKMSPHSFQLFPASVCRFLYVTHTTLVTPK